MTAYKQFIPDWVPTSTNQLLGHWGAAARKKKLDREMIWAHCAHIPKAEKKRTLRVRLYINGKGRSPDPDNIQKSLHDALKKNGLIVDDSDKWLLAMQPEIIRPALSKGTEIFLMDMEDIKPNFADGIRPELTVKSRNRAESLDA